jgi:hypothetical protein
MGPVEASAMRRTTSVNAKRILHVSSSLLVLGVALATPAGCSQPPIRCTAALGEAIARYKVKGTVPAACGASTLPGTAAADPATFPLGVESYVPSPADPNASSEVNSMAIKAEWIGVRIQDAQNNAGLASYPYTGDPPKPPPDGPPSTNFPYAWGKFDSVYPDEYGICTVSSMSASSMDYPDIPSHPSTDANGNAITVPDQPDTKVKYAWSNVRTYVTASSIGVQTFANLSITQDACTISYIVSILVPRIQCASANDPTVADPTLCDPNPNGPNNPSGSGISEDVVPSCENISSDPANPDWECLPPASDPKANLQ